MGGLHQPVVALRPIWQLLAWTILYDYQFGQSPMIPIALFMGLAGGFTKLKLWTIVPAGVLWAVILVATGDPTINPLLRAVGGLLAGAINAAVGVIAALGVRVLGRELWGRLRRRPAS